MTTKEELKEELKQAKYEMRHPLNKGTMDGDYWKNKVDELEQKLQTNSPLTNPEPDSVSRIDGNARKGKGTGK